MKKIIFLLTLALLCAAVSGCSGDSNDDVGGNPNIGLLNPAVLSVGVEIGYPPFEMFDDNGNPIGFDIDMATEIANILGVRVEFNDTAWDGIFAGLDVDKYDVVISAVTIRPDRALSMDFSNPYIENWQAIVVRKGDDPVTSMDGLNGLNVGLQASTASHDLLDEYIELGLISCTISPYVQVLNAFDDLRLGRVDCILTDSTVAEGYIAREPDAFEITWHQKNEPGAEAERFGIAMKKGNDLLVNAVNDALRQLETNGRLDQLRYEWLQ
jgi:polar amino acid transport system substrate-binding protein